MEHFGPLGILIFIIVKVVQAIMRNSNAAQLDKGKTPEQTNAERDLQATLQRKLEEAKARARAQADRSRHGQSPAGTPAAAGEAAPTSNWPRPALDQARQSRRDMRSTGRGQAQSAPTTPLPPPVPVPAARTAAPAPPQPFKAPLPPPAPAYDVAKDPREIDVYAQGLEVNEERERAAGMRIVPTAARPSRQLATGVQTRDAEGKSVPATARANSNKRRLRLTPQTAKAAMIYSEILRPPLALR